MADVDKTTFAENHSVAWNVFEERKKGSMFYLINIAYTITIFSGCILNIPAFLVLVRCRLWVKHEGFLYLATILCTNVGVLLFTTSSFWLRSFYTPMDHRPADSSQAMCKLFSFLKSIFFASGWPATAFLLTCYLRAGLTSRSDRCPAFAVKFCTLFASKVVVGAVFGSLFVFGLPYLVVYDLDEDGSYCIAKLYVARVVFQLIEITVMLLLPCVVLFAVLLRLLCSCASKKGRSDCGGSAQNPEEVVTGNEMRRMAITISVMIMLTQLAVVFARAVFRGVKNYPPIIEVIHGLTLSTHPVLCFSILSIYRQAVRAQLRIK